MSIWQQCYEFIPTINLAYQNLEKWKTIQKKIGQFNRCFVDKTERQIYFHRNYR